MSGEIKGSESLVWPTGSHPVEQAALWIGNAPLYDWQVDALVAGSLPHSRGCISVLNEGGKSVFIAPVFLFSIAATFPRARCYATSGNEEQLFDQLFSALRKIADRFGYAVTLSNMKITLPNGSTIMCTVKKEAASVEGKHGEYDPEIDAYCPVAYFIDESKHILNDKEFAVRRIDPDFYLAMSTPPTESDMSMKWFWDGIDMDTLDEVIINRKKELCIEEPRTAYDKKIDEVLIPEPLHSFPGDYFSYRRIITWTPTEAPHLFTPLKERERRNIEKKFGKKSAYVQSMLYGMASDGSGENSVFSDDNVTAMRKAMTPDSGNQIEHGDTRSAADVSGTTTGDAMVFGVRNGTEVMLLEEQDNMDDIAQAEYLTDVNKKLDLLPYQFTIDGGGVGASIGNIMEQTHEFSGINRFQYQNDPMFDFQFNDRYTEMHWIIKDLLIFGVLSMPWCPVLLKDMRERRYIEMSKNGKLKIEDKKAHRKRTGHSPDWLDTLIYLFSDFPIENVRRGRVSSTEKAIIKPRKNSLMKHPHELRDEQPTAGGLIKQPAFGDLMRRARGPNFGIDLNPNKK